MNDILVERDGPIATVVFNRPKLRNAISFAMWTEIARVSRALGEDDGVRAVVYRLEGLDEPRRERLRALALEAFESQDYKEGTRAFLEKRPPRFQGR